MAKYGKKNHVNLDPLSYSSCLLGEAKVGKEQPISEPVLAENGWIRMGDIKTGMKVYGEDGVLHKVIGVYPQGVKEVYEVTFRDGSKTRCGLEHLWKVAISKNSKKKQKNNTDYEVLSLKEILRDYKRFLINSKHKNGGYFYYKYSIPVNNAVSFDNNADLMIEPYKFGVDLCQDNLRKRFIPKEYMYSSIENRIKLLSGIINSYGDVENNRKIVITIHSARSSSAIFVEQIMELIRSLGFIATMQTYTKNYNTKIEKEYRVSIIPSKYSKYCILCLCDKIEKKLHDNEIVIQYDKTITNIKFVGKEESQCIMVDNPSHLYITNDYIVTHNTTLVKEVCEKLVGEDGYMFLELGQERGGDAIEGINHVNCPEWEMEYDELTNSAGFLDVCEDIIENKTSDYPDLKVVIWDTYDQLITIAEHESIVQWNRECRDSGHPEKVAKSINAAWGGFGKGEKKAMELMFDMKARLKKVGVETFVIGHVKTKDVTDVVSGETYQTLTSDQQQNYFNALKKNLHFLGLAYIDRTIAKEKTGRKIIKGKNKVDEEVNKVKEESRKIKFRDDNYAVDSGSRFADIIPEINLDADEFIKALTNAILAEQKKSGMTVKQTQEEQDKIREAEEKRIAETEQKNNEQRKLDKIIIDIVQFFAENKSNIDVVKPILEKVKELGYDNPKEIDSVKDAQTILDMTQQG